MKVFLIILFWLLSLSISAQDIVYDSLKGNKSNFRRIRFGTEGTINSTWYENQGIICRSKVLLSARVWDGLKQPDDFKIINFGFPNDIVTFEFKTTGNTNLIIYKYEGPVDTIYYASLRKAELGSDLFTGQYLFVEPIITTFDTQFKLNIYNGIGSNKTLFLSLTEGQITEADCRDYVMSDEVTFETINGTKLLLIPVIKEFITVDSIKIDINVWPNPVTDKLNLSIKDNTGIVFRIYDQKASLLYEEKMMSETVLIDMLNYKSGLYILLITDYSKGNIIQVLKIIKK